MDLLTQWKKVESRGDMRASVKVVCYGETVRAWASTHIRYIRFRRGRRGSVEPFSSPTNLLDVRTLHIRVQGSLLLTNDGEHTTITS